MEIDWEVFEERKFLEVMPRLVEMPALRSLDYTG